MRGLLVAAAAAAAEAVRPASIAVRPLETVGQLRDAGTVLDRVWDIPPGRPSKIQPQLLRALGRGGNYVVGAYQPGGTMVGAGVAFFTAPLGAAMHSHITGVLPGRAGGGIGAAVKWHQRRWALRRGPDQDHLDLRPADRPQFARPSDPAGRPETCFVDFYGVMQDGPNRRQPTDRMRVCWDLAAAGTVDAECAVRRGGPLAAVRMSARRSGPDPEATRAVIGIPRDIEQIAGPIRRRRCPGGTRCGRRRPW